MRSFLVREGVRGKRGAVRRSETRGIDVTCDVSRLERSIDTVAVLSNIAANVKRGEIHITYFTFFADPRLHRHH